jgi:exopolysaccharide production protein ExoQ
MIRRWPYLAAAFLIANSLAALNIFDRTIYGEWDGKPGDKVTQSLNLLMIAFGLALFGRGLRQLLSMRTGAALMLGLGIFLLSSVVWSADPQGTIRQGIIYLSVVTGAIGIASTLDVDEYMKLVAIVCGLAALSSLFLAVVSPDQVFTTVGDYRGIFSQKNTLGQAMVVGALASLHGLRVSRQQKWRNRLIFGLVMIACFLSKSATSLSTIVVLGSVHTVTAMIRKRDITRLLGIAVGFMAVVILVVLSIFPDWLLGAMGKDPTLTGRTEVWSYVISDIYQRPLLGWGYNAFWSFANPAALEISNAVHWTVPQAHNGLLEILLNVGVVGAVFFFFLLARNIGLGLRCLCAPDTTLAISSLLCCAIIILVGISEMVLINGLEASTPLFFVTGLYTEKALWLRQRRSAALRRIANRYGMPRQMRLSELQEKTSGGSACRRVRRRVSRHGRRRLNVRSICRRSRPTIRRI